MRTNSAGRAANGNGSIRKIIKNKNGKKYTYWEARVTVGYDPGTGKQKQRSVSGKTQKEVAERLRQLTSDIDNGTYREPTKITVSEWMDTWANGYLINVKPFTVATYKGSIRNHIRPALGAVRLDELRPHQIQKFYNDLMREKQLSAKTVKNIHGVIHRALKQAVMEGLIRTNPADACVLPRAVRKDIAPLDEEESKAFMVAIRGHRYEALFAFTLFTGLREGEVLGLQWQDVDFDRAMLTVRQQLQREKHKDGKYYLAPLKNDRPRTLALAPFVITVLQAHKARQEEWRRQAGTAWENSGFVFTNELGHHLAIHTVYKDFKKIVVSIGRADARFHDLRHSYAVASIRAGDDIKTVQGNLGHATAAFTLDVYGHVTDQMKKASAARMEEYITGVLGLSAS